MPNNKNNRQERKRLFNTIIRDEKKDEIPKLADVDIGLDRHGYRGDTLLFWALKKNKPPLPIITQLLIKGANPNASISMPPKGETTTPFIYVLTEKANALWCFIIAMINRGANLNITLPRGDTLVHFVCRHLDDSRIHQILKTVLERKTNPFTHIDDYNDDGLTAAYVLVSVRDLQKLLPLLLEHGARVEDGESKYRESILNCAIKKKLPLNMIITIISFVKDIDYRTPVNGAGALHLACHYDYPDVVDSLLDAGANIELLSANDDTPLHAAANVGSLNCIQKLLERGADCRKKNKANLTPEMVACAMGHISCVQALKDWDAPQQASNDELPLCSMESLIACKTIIRLIRIRQKILPDCACGLCRHDG